MSSIAIIVTERKVQAMEKMGYCQYSLGKVDAAVTTWTAAATVAEQLELSNEEASVRRHLHAHYVNAGNDAGANAMAQRLSALQSAPVATPV